MMMAMANKVANDMYELSGKKVLVVGLGRTGLSVAKFLKLREAVVSVTDTRVESEIVLSEELTALGVELQSGGHVEESFKEAELIVVSPGVDSRIKYLNDARARGVEVISDIELFFRYADVPVIVIAGTNGKSTTTMLIGEILSGAGKRVFVGGNIGTPATDYFLSEANVNYDICVLEVSSFHLETVGAAFKPLISVLLNITEDHLDRYDDFDDYATTKFRVFENQSSSDYGVVNMGDSYIANRLREMQALSHPTKVIGFSSAEVLTEGLYLKDDDIVFSAGEIKEHYPTDEFRLTGTPNKENAMAAIAVSKIMGISSDVVMRGLKNFMGLPHRMEFIRSIEGVSYINDSKSTNAGALLKAIEGFKGCDEGVEPSLILIAGGRDKGGDFGLLRESVSYKVKTLIAIGECREKFVTNFRESTSVIRAEDMTSAVLIAFALGVTGDTVLLSPGCSSFDAFKNFEDRGDSFRELVEWI